MTKFRFWQIETRHHDSDAVNATHILFHRMLPLERGYVRKLLRPLGFGALKIFVNSFFVDQHLDELDEQVLVISQRDEHGMNCLHLALAGLSGSGCKSDRQRHALTLY